jgi:UDP-N-acetylglucosamine:LPS N-acetylglucosamine transferase
MTTIDLIYFDAGGGHRAAALALQEAIRQLGLPWTVRLVHLMQVLDPARRVERLTGHGPEHLYNWRLERGWTLGLGPELRLLQRLIRAGHPWLLKTLRAHWAAGEPPDLVVSLVPNFNRVLRESLAQALPGVPFATVMTDLADLPPRFWIEPGIDQHLVCGTDHALAQARAAGLGPDRIHRTSGMIIRPEFYRSSHVDKRAERLSLGLDPDLPTGLVMFGGHGSRQMIRIAQCLDDRQLVLLCGHHAGLAETLRAMRRSAPHAVLGFTSQVRRYMGIADYFIGKPGPGALSEALQCGLPVLTFRNAWTMPQERYNTDWIGQQGVGLVVDAARDLPAALRALLDGLDGYREAVGRIENRAVFELPDIFAAILASPCAAHVPIREPVGSTA